MFVKISKSDGRLEGSVSLPSSKSISNRLLMIRAISGHDFNIKNLSEAGDTLLLLALLEDIRLHRQQRTESQPLILDCGNAGTVFRFLVPYLANLPGIWILTGSDRMKVRPVEPLVTALKQLGASIEYLDISGFPPLHIEGKILQGGEVRVDASASSQFASALMMLGGFLAGGLKIELTGDIVSQPYLRMTAGLLKQFGLQTTFMERYIIIREQQFTVVQTFVEPDWSSASYWFEAICLAEEAELLLKGLKFTGLQGDEAVAGLYYRLGVECEEVEDGLLLRKGIRESDHFTFDFRHNPDLAMTIAVTIAGLGISGRLSGLKNLAIKESHRLEALQNELRKVGCRLSANEDELIIEASVVHNTKEVLMTYADHRMALSFGPLAAITGEIVLHEPEVINKSYPGFWEDLRSVGFKVEFY